MPENKIDEQDILNFALNLEYLEAEFYTYATIGKSITNFGIGTKGRVSGSNPTTGGTTVGGKQVTFSDNESVTRDIATQIGADERAHVVLLRGALGSAACAMPNIDLGALGFGFGDQNDFLRAARILEDIGVTAYSGAAGFLKTPDIITAAACLLGAEAEHAATIRTNCAIEDTNDTFGRRGLDPSAQRTGKASPLHQGQRWADRDQDGWTGALPRVWRESRCETRRLFPERP
jgi:Ferritin-like domain